MINILITNKFSNIKCERKKEIYTKTIFFQVTLKIKSASNRDRERDKERENPTQSNDDPQYVHEGKELQVEYEGVDEVGQEQGEQNGGERGQCDGQGAREDPNCVPTKTINVVVVYHSIIVTNALMERYVNF